MTLLAPKVIFGGTYDPVHFGHLRTAVELADWLDLPCVELLPARDPVHKAVTGADAQSRFEMLKLACEPDSRLNVNDLELNSPEDSYTILTLRTLRARLGEHQPLILVMGMDSFQAFTSWREWNQFLTLCHLLVVQRPGYQPVLESRLEQLVAEHEVLCPSALKNSPAGALMFHQLTPLGISSTQIREQIYSGESPRFLLPDEVWRYIQDKRLYGFKPKSEH